MKHRETNIQAGLARTADARFLSSIDLLGYSGELSGAEYKQRRLDFWTELLSAQEQLPLSERSVYVVKEGGLYIGWGRKVLTDNGAHALDQYFAPGRDYQRAVSALFSVAGVSQEPLTIAPPAQEPVEQPLVAV